jgi:hypothetical protein
LLFQRGANLFVVDGISGGARKLLDNLGRRSCGSQQSDPYPRVKTGHSCLGDRRNGWRDRGALRLRHRESLQLARLDMRGQRRRHIEHQRNAAGEQIGDRLIASALIGHDWNFRAGLLVEQLGRHIARGRIAGRAECQAFGLAFGERDQLLQVIGRDRRMRHQQVGNDAEKRNRRQILGKVEIRFGLCRIERVGDRRHEQRVAVGRGARHRIGCDHAAVARPVFDNEGLTETDFHPLADQPGKDIRGRARSKSDHDLDRMGRIGLRQN